MSALHLSVTNYAGVTVAVLQESALLNQAVIEPVAAALNRLVERDGVSKLILDFSRVKLLSSQFLGTLTSLAQTCKASKATLALCSIRADVRKVFSLTGLDTVLKVYKDDVEALRAFGVNLSS